MRYISFFSLVFVLFCLTGCQIQIPVETSSTTVTLDGMPIAACQIGEKTAISLNDLEHYGFTVEAVEKEVRVTAEMSFDPGNAPKAVEKSGNTYNGCQRPAKGLGQWDPDPFVFV